MRVHNQVRMTCVIPVGREKSGRVLSVWIKLSLLALFTVLMIAGAWVSGIQDWIRPDRLGKTLERTGVLAPFAYMFIMAGSVVISPIPSLPLDAAAGAIFGPLWGTFYSVLGAEAGAVASFLIARGLGKEAISRLLKSEVGFCRLCSERYLFMIILLARLLPVFSFDLVSYGAGLSRISLRGFALATLIGMIPPTFVFNYFGSGIFSGSGYVLFLGAILVILFLLVPKWIKQYNPWGLYDRLEMHRGEP